LSYIGTVGLPREIKQYLSKVLEDVIKKRYGNAMYASLKSYIEAQSNGKTMIELMLLSPKDLAGMLMDYLGGSEDTTIHFLETIIRGIYEELGDTPELDVHEALRNLMKGSEEGFRNLLLEVAFKLGLKLKKPMF